MSTVNIDFSDMAEDEVVTVTSTPSMISIQFAERYNQTTPYTAEEIAEAKRNRKMVARTWVGFCEFRDKWNRTPSSLQYFAKKCIMNDNDLITYAQRAYPRLCTRFGISDKF